MARVDEYGTFFVDSVPRKLVNFVFNLVKLVSKESFTSFRSGGGRFFHFHCSFFSAMLETFKTIFDFVAKHVLAVLLLVVAIFLLPDIKLFRDVIRMRDECTGYLVLVGLFCLCVLVARCCRMVWEAFLAWRERIAHEAQQKKAEEVQRAKEQAKEQARVDREVVLFSRLSVEERRMLLQWYSDPEKNQYADSMNPSISKLQREGYLKMGDWNVFYLSDRACDLFDARYEELKNKITEDENNQ